MNITETLSYDKEGEVEPAGLRGLLVRKLFLALLILLVGALGFGLGRLGSGQGRAPIRIEYDPQLTDYLQPTPARAQTAAAQNAASPRAQNAVVASKNGSKYHYPHCPGAKQIKEANKIAFNSAAEAEASGYSLAANCSPR